MRVVRSLGLQCSEVKQCRERSQRFHFNSSQSSVVSVVRDIVLRAVKYKRVLVLVR